MPVTRVTLIRHGETQWNREGRVQGHLDIPLSEVGVAQAQAVAERLAAEPFDALFSSDLARAYATAACVARRTGHSIAIDPRLRERHLGMLQAFTWDESARLHPEVYERYHRGESDYVVPGGESARQFFDRVIGALTEIARRLAGRRVVVVTHGGVMDALHRHVTGRGPEGSRLPRLLNASLNEFDYRDDTWSLHAWGDVAHLAGRGALDDL